MSLDDIDDFERRQVYTIPGCSPESFRGDAGAETRRVETGITQLRFLGKS
jgi:hypothetical protein